MPSYEPVDLSGVCNAGVDVLGDEPGDAPLGRVDLRGLPFLIGPQAPSAEQCFLLPGAPVTVGIGRLVVRGLLLSLVVPALFTDWDGRGLHDRASGTAVVRR